MNILRRTQSRTVLVLGGARSGKSHLAEQMLRDVDRVTYVACGAPADSNDREWAERVAAHQARRPSGWDTLESLDLPSVIRTSGGPALIECLGTWLAATMDHCGVWSDRIGADVLLADHIDALLASWTRPARRLVAVSNEVGSGIVPATVSGRRFRDELGRINAKVAAASDQVWLVTAGIGKRLR